ncbi:MAG TPA: cytidine deaminase [bacterium]|nr:cytidine deaminase [bacterium]
MSGCEELKIRATEAMAKAYAPYSSYHVGAALLTRSGKIYSGCNVENASFGASICAERVAIFKAVSEGEAEFAAMAITAQEDPDVVPCGICRQVLWELAGDIDLLLGSGDSAKVVKLSSLYPEPFKKA